MKIRKKKKKEKFLSLLFFSHAQCRFRKYPGLVVSPPPLSGVETNEMQMAGSEWRNVLGPRCRSLPSSPTSAYPTRFRTPWKTVENAYQTVCTTTKPSRRRFHRVYRPRNTSPIFFSPPPPHRGKSDSGGAFAVFPSARISNRVSLLRACVCVCVIDARVPIYPRARSTAAHLGTSHYARRKEVEATERGRERGREGEIRIAG